MGLMEEELEKNSLGGLQLCPTVVTKYREPQTRKEILNTTKNQFALVRNPVNIGLTVKHA